jgi:glutathione S-transferase
MALLPFIRQFAHVDRDWFAQTPYRHLQAWLEGLLQSGLFVAVMIKQQEQLL